MIRITDDFYCTAQEFGGIKRGEKIRCNTSGEVINYNYCFLNIYACGQEVDLLHGWVCNENSFFINNYDKNKTPEQNYNDLINSEFDRILAEYEKEKNG